MVMGDLRVCTSQYENVEQKITVKGYLRFMEETVNRIAMNKYTIQMKIP